MFDLKFSSSVLDKMPVGTSFRDSDHEVSKRVGGWKCEGCYSADLESSSSALMSDSSEKYALDKFAGAEIDPNDLDPRLLAFLPAGTRVADCDTQLDHRHYWYKTKSGRWVWAEDKNEAEAAANKGLGHEDLDAYESVRPFRLYSVGTSEASESDGTPIDPARLTAAEATALRGVVYDNGGEKWIYTSEGGYRLVLSGNLLGQLRQQLPADYAPYSAENPRAESAPEPETEPEEISEGKTVFSAAEATNFKDCRFRDRDNDVWLFDEETERWRFILSDGSLSSFLQHVALSAGLEPFTLVEGEIKAEAETEAEAEKTEFSEKEASEQKDTVFEDNDGDTWFFDYGLQAWRAIGPGWAYAREELFSFHGPYTKIGPLHEFERGWTAEEAEQLKDEALEDSDGDTWIYDVPSEMWKCSNRGVLDRDELDAYYQPYRIKKAAQARTAAPTVGYDEPFVIAGGTEEVAFEGSAKEAVELLDRIARSLESIDRKLGDK